MTAINYVSQREMEKKTGFRKALGYALPKEDTILVRKGLPAKKKKEVLAHEEEHMRKGEEGPFLDFLGDVFGASKQASAAKKSARIQADSAQKAIDYQRESRDMARMDQAPYREGGYTALEALMSMTGLPIPAGGVRSYQAAPEVDPSQPVVPDSVPDGRMRYFQSKFGRDLSGANPQQQARMYRKFGIEAPGYNSSYRMHGGPIGDDQYIINEIGPEDVYHRGAITRSSSPKVIQPPGDGYVKPHGRVFGGFVGAGPLASKAVGYAPNNQSVTNAPQASVGPSPVQYQDNGYVAENPGGQAGGYQFQTDPGYQFRFEEGMRALDRSSAARGGLLSGGFARKAIRYGQGYASNEYSNVYNRIASIAGIGGTAASNSGNAAMMAGSNMGNAIMNAGAARASGYTAQGNVWGDAIRSAGDYAQDQFGDFVADRMGGIFG